MNEIAMITPNEHEKHEWARCAKDCLARGSYAQGHRFQQASMLLEGTRMPLLTFDSLLSAYRSWLVFNTAPAQDLRTKPVRRSTTKGRADDVQGRITT